MAATRNTNSAKLVVYAENVCDLACLFEPKGHVHTWRILLAELKKCACVCGKSVKNVHTIPVLSRAQPGNVATITHTTQKG